LTFVPVVLVGRSVRQAGSAHAAFLVLPVLAIVPLAELLSHTPILKQDQELALIWIKLNSAR
jgi:hypothetical protein